MNKRFLLSLLSTLLINVEVNAHVEKLSADYPPIDVTVKAVPAWSALYNLNNGPLAPVINRCVADDVWALTFDDGPSKFTLRVVNDLRETETKATFFVVGSRIVNNVKMLKKIHAHGHQIGVHTWSHSNLTALSKEEILAELLWTMKAIYDVIGVIPTYFSYLLLFIVLVLCVLRMER